MSNMLTYKDAGVDVDAGNRFVENIKPLIQRTRRPEMMGDLGGFGGLFALPKGYQEPILVSSTDGVGTKLRLCIETGQHDTIGIDLVAMCVNDIIVQGAEPLFFLDYFATGHLNLEVAESILQGITEGCVQANASLIGGETAEMPGLYQASDYDLAGFCVGIVEKTHLLDGTQAREGDILLGLPSSGPHANGYSLIRKIMATRAISLDMPFEGSSLKSHLLAPTMIYVKPLLALVKQGLMKGAAHITGGGLTENLPRVFSDNLQAIIKLDAWQRPSIFQWLQEQGNVSAPEMLRTFNNGIGMVVIVSPEGVEAATALLKSFQIFPWVIGHLTPKIGESSVIFKGTF